MSIRLERELTRCIILDTGNPEQYPAFVRDWIASGDACIIPLTNSGSLEMIKRMDLAFLGKKPVLLLGMRKGNEQVEDMEARSFALDHSLEYMHRYDGDPFEYVTRVYFSRSTEGTWDETTVPRLRINCLCLLFMTNSSYCAWNHYHFKENTRERLTTKCPQRAT